MNRKFDKAFQDYVAFRQLRRTRIVIENLPSIMKNWRAAVEDDGYLDGPSVDVGYNVCIRWYNDYLCQHMPLEHTEL